MRKAYNPTRSTPGWYIPIGSTPKECIPTRSTPRFPRRAPRPKLDLLIWLLNTRWWVAGVLHAVGAPSKGFSGYFYRKNAGHKRQKSHHYSWILWRLFVNIIVFFGTIMVHFLAILWHFFWCHYGSACGTARSLFTTLCANLAPDIKNIMVFFCQYYGTFFVNIMVLFLTILWHFFATLKCNIIIP